MKTSIIFAGILMASMLPDGEMEDVCLLRFFVLTGIIHSQGAQKHHHPSSLAENTPSSRIYYKVLYRSEF